MTDDGRPSKAAWSTSDARRRLRTIASLGLAGLAILLLCGWFWALIYSSSLAIGFSIAGLSLCCAVIAATIGLVGLRRRDGGLAALAVAVSVFTVAVTLPIPIIGVFMLALAN